MAGILVVTEIKDGQFRKCSLEIASEAAKRGKELGIPAVALVFGHGVKPLAGQLGKYGIERILVLDSDQLANAYLQTQAQIVEAAAKKCDASHIFFSSSTIGKAISAIVAAKMETSALTDCVSLMVSGGQMLVQRPVYAGKTTITVASLKKTVIVSLRPNVFSIVPLEVKSNIEELQVSFAEKHLQTRVVETKATEGKKMDLTEAGVIVSGGRGMKGPENFHLLEKLASALNGVVGVSRAVVDAGWRPHEEQVGQTGKTVAPQLYIACGISGAIQHLAGMRTSKVIVAINKDPDAPIFQLADYGIVGDAMEVLPKMIEEAKKL